MKAHTRCCYPSFFHALVNPPYKVFGTSTEFSDAPTVSDIYNMRRILSARMNAIHDQTERLGANMERMERVNGERMERMEQVRFGLAVEWLCHLYTRAGSEGTAYNIMLILIEY